VRFFFDNCVSPKLVEALQLLDPRHELVHHRARFAADTADPDWIAALAAEGDWIIISGDPRISRGKAERAAWIESRLTAFFCGDGWASKRLMRQASELLGWWDDIVELSKKATPGAGYLMQFKTAEPIQIYPSSAAKKRKKKKK